MTITTSKLTEDDIMMIRYGADFAVKDLAKVFGVCKTTIRNIQHRRAWKYLNPEIS